VWRNGHEIVTNPDRPFIRNLDDLPLPRHDLLPLARYRAPLVRGSLFFRRHQPGLPGGVPFLH